MDADEARTGDDKSGCPAEAFPQIEPGGEKFGAPESDEDNSQQVGSGAEQEVGEAGHDRPDGTDEIFRDGLGGALLAEEEPRGHISRRVGDEGEKEQGAGAEQDETKHLAPSFAAAFFCCFTAGQGQAT